VGVAAVAFQAQLSGDAIEPQTHLRKGGILV
jgi:hypothetical protein